YFYKEEDLYKAVAEPIPGVCRVCGCTEDNPCYHPEHENCSWVDDECTLCSHCASEAEGGYGIKDTSKGADRYSFLDGCSIRRVVDEMEDAPVLPRNLRIAVSSGSRLVLNFPGTVQVHRVTLGDTVIREGVVSEKTHPQYIGGMGSLTVVPVVSGLRMIVR
ncbi:MAG: hypothetical protein IJK04_04830, partial [Kiritimatiellae bacterium]|nr:hypothetical protein [Kiritimatiellia bacterium]